MSSTQPGVAVFSWTLSLRLLAVVGCAAFLAGCYTDQTMPPNYPLDYRQRHPIAIHEGVYTVELFIGTRRGELTLDQRADVVSFAHRWRRDAGGGVLIDLPSGTVNAGAAASALAEVRAILAASGVPRSGTEVRPYRPNDPRTMSPLRLNY